MKYIIAFVLLMLVLTSPVLADCPTPEPIPVATSTPAAAPPRVWVQPQLSPIVDDVIVRLKDCSPPTYDLIVNYILVIYDMPAAETALAFSWSGGIVKLGPQVIASARLGEPGQYQLMLILAHEARHQWQYINAKSMTFEEQERDADTWVLPIFDQCPTSMDPLLVKFLRRTITDRIANPPNASDYN